MADHEYNSSLSRAKSNRIFNQCFETLKFCGILLNPAETKIGKRWSVIRSTASYMMHFCVVFQTVFDLFLIRNELSKVTLNISTTGLTFGMFMRNSIFLYYQSKIGELHRELWEEKYFTGDAETKVIFDKALHFLKRIYQVFLFAALSAIPCWLSMPYLAGEFSLPFRGWFPFDVEKYPNFYYAYVFQIVCIPYIAASIICCDILVYSIMLLIAAHYSVLIKNIKSLKGLFSSENDRCEADAETRRATLKRQMIDIIKHHHQIIRFVQTFCDLFPFVLFIQLVGGTALITLFIFELMFSELTTKLVAEFMVVSGGFFDLFMYCLLGTIIKNKSFEAAQEMYNTDWYEYRDPGMEMRPYILLFMNQSQRPYKIMAWKLVSVTLPAFLSIVEKIHSLMAVLPQLLKKYIKE